MTNPIDWKVLFDAISAGGSYIVDEKKREDLLTKIELLIRKNRKIVVFGNSGCGKSQLMNAVRNSVKVPNKTNTPEKIKFALENFPIRFIDTPGDLAAKPLRLKQIHRIINDGVEGVINVIAYGYQETKGGDKSLAFDANNNLIQSFVDKNRDEELDRVNEWIEDINPSNCKWIINLVNKSDIWWSDFSTVTNYYQTGPYEQKFAALKNFIPVITLPYCAIIRPYFNVKTSGIFGDEAKEYLHSYFIGTLLNLLKDA